MENKHEVINRIYMRFEIFLPFWISLEISIFLKISLFKNYIMYLNLITYFTKGSQMCQVSDSISFVQSICNLIHNQILNREIKRLFIKHQKNCLYESIGQFFIKHICASYSNSHQTFFKRWAVRFFRKSQL